MLSDYVANLEDFQAKGLKLNKSKVTINLVELGNQPSEIFPESRNGEFSNQDQHLKLNHPVKQAQSTPARPIKE